ncbi:metal-dependent hydrolase [Pollutimonas harenae]|uniref:Metal-dependent hydrolase n=1 Tax=Pollutimonas harenae TaxID=657015 RepID=A0A853GWB6_9BURK|nr:metal-dependent hydrolase [Pollutimonas harenae]NYT84040.1 metal-dependent hydrolase [Pollutimonas harenae]TEA73535.1 metal-dependent hydrolase [Pollutimonas harenae]
MDSLTQAVLGAGIQGAMLGRFHGRKALVAGALLGTLPDLDVLIDYGDPVLNMINHRGFSHSLFVLTGLSVLFTLLARRWRPCPDYGASRLFLAIWLVLITHTLLDAFTAYGTQLLWPFKPTPTSWSSLFIIDPFYTLPLLSVVIAGLVMGKHPALTRTLCWGLGLSTCYLVLSVAAKAVIEDRVQHRLTEQGETVVSMFSTPQPFNILLWRIVARTADDHYIETISSLLDTSPPEHIKLPLNTALADNLPESPQLAGLRWFTGDWLRYDAIEGQLVASDLRMGLGTGHYSFRFLMAERTGPNHGWQAVTPVYWPRERDTAELGAVIRRIWQQQPPLPLERWERTMTQLPAASGRDTP